MGYPWASGATLTSTDLNAALALAYANAQAALTAAVNAQGLATTAVATLGPPKPVSVTINWPAIPVTNGTYVLSATLPYAVTWASFDASTGSAGGSFVVTFRGNGLVIGNTSNLPVTVAGKTNTALVAGVSNPLSVGAGTLLDVVVQVIGGSPADAYVCLNGQRTS